MVKWYENCSGLCEMRRAGEVELQCIYRQCWFHPLSVRAELTKSLAPMKSLDTCFT
jgi:hypothetical protein